MVSAWVIHFINSCCSYVTSNSNLPIGSSCLTLQEISVAENYWLSCTCTTLY